MFVCGFTMAFTSVHMIPYLTDMPEHSTHTMQTTASLALSVVGACSIIGAIVMGFLSDRAGHRQMLALTYFLRGLSFLILLAVGSWIPGIFLAAVVLGISWTSTTPLASAMAADIYGRASLATIFGFIFTAMNVGSGVGAWLAIPRSRPKSLRSSLRPVAFRQSATMIRAKSSCVMSDGALILINLRILFSMTLLME